MSTSEEVAMEKYDQEDNVLSPRTLDISAAFDLTAKSSSINMSLDLMSRRKDLPDDLACFLQQQKQRQARQETTMRSFPSRGDMDMEKLEAKKKKNIHEDPVSHRIIEKRRRDRMNNCLADLSRLIPSSYLKKGRGRIEKTEIIEMAIKHIKHLQHHPCTKQDGCELAQEIETGLSKASSVESFRVGYHECLTETMHFLVEREGLYSGSSFCVRLRAHLQKHFDKLGRASTSELFSVVGRSWKGTSLPSETATGGKDREPAVKSEFGFSSEESGYGSVKMDESQLRVPGSQDDSDLAASLTTSSWSHCMDSSELPSDLSLHQDRVEGGDSAVLPNLYKFKSNIRQRFDSSRSVLVEDSEDRETILIPEKRTRHDSNSTDVDPTFEVEPLSSEAPVRRDSFSPCGSGSFRERHKSGPSTSPLPPPIPRPLPLPLPVGPIIPIFALSTKGSYYIPMSVDSALLGPCLPLLTEESVGPFHPVTLSVKFTTIQDPGLFSGDSRSWKHQRRGVISNQQSVIKHWRDPPV